MGTNNTFLEKEAKRLKFINWRGVFFKDELKNLKALDVECGILGSKRSEQDEINHWTCWFKVQKNKYCFDSFGLVPAPELYKYLKSPIIYSTFQIQQFNEDTCGEWCLWFLNSMNNVFKKNKEVSDDDYVDIILQVVNNKTY